MKSILKHRGLITVLLLLLGPYILVLFIEPIWLARVLGQGLWSILIIPIGIILLFEKVNIFFGPGNWLEKSFKKSKLDFWTKVAIFVLTLLGFYGLTVPYIKDVKMLIKNNQPEEIVVTVIDTRTGVGAMSVKLTLEQFPGSIFSAYYFPRNSFDMGYTYKIWYLPNTKRIVDAELITTNQSDSNNI